MNSINFIGGLALFSLLVLPVQAAQKCHANAVNTTPNSDFTVHDNGTITHKNTGLMWKVCSEGQTWSSEACQGAVTSMTWQQALQAGESLNTAGGYAGHSDWRLPNIKELKSIAELRCREPALNTTLFFNPGSIYWTSTLDISRGERAWVVFFSSGSDYFFDRTQSHSVRLVRKAAE